MAYPSRFTEFFGPCMWKTMHSVAFSYPESPTQEERKNYIDFFNSLRNVIPCPQCGVHYTQYLQENPITADNAEDLSMWVYKLHDTVNKRNKKESPSYEEVKERYTGFNKEKHQRLLKMKESDQEEFLADPTFKMKLGGDAPETSAPSETEKAQTIVRFFTIAALGFGAMYILRKRYQEDNKNKKN